MLISLKAIPNNRCFDYPKDEIKSPLFLDAPANALEESSEKFAALVSITGIPLMMNAKSQV